MQNRIIFLLPCLVFLHAVWLYPLNVPFWDDYSVVLLPAIKMHEAWSRGDINGFITWLFQPNAGHLPMLTHAIAWLQVTLLGSIDFRWSTIMGDMGLVLAVVLLTRYFIKTLQFDFQVVVPIPFLLLALVHWEAMDFMVPAWQFYWGSCLLPLMLLMSISSGNWFLAGFSFWGALYLSSGALALLPLACMYGVFRKQWKGLLVFMIIASAALLPYFYYLPPSSVDKGFPDVATSLIFILSFMGSAIPNPSGYLYPLMFFHILLGIVILVLGAFLLLKEAKADVLKLVLIYIVMLAVMALVARGYSVNTQIPSRYAVFSLLAIVCLYGLFLITIRKDAPLKFRYGVTAMTFIAMFFWVYSAYSCRQVLEKSQASRIVVTQNYLRGNKDALREMLWDVTFGEDMLHYAKKYGIYDMEESGIR